MEIGILGKAMAGAGTAVQPAVLEAERGEIMKMRDAALNQYENQRLTGIIQPFEQQQQERQIQAQKENVQSEIGSREKISFAEMAQRQPEVDAQVKQINAAVGLAGQQFQEGKIKLDQLKQIQGLRDQMLTETDPKRFEKLAETFSMMTGQDMTKATSSMYGVALYNPHKAPDQQAIIHTGMDDSSGGTGGGQTPSINDPFKSPPPEAAGGATSAPAAYPGYPALPAEQAKTRKPAAPAPAAEPSAGSLQPLDNSGPGPFEKAAGFIGGAVTKYKQANYHPGVAMGPGGQKTEIRPGLTSEVNGRKITFDSFVKNSPNGPVWLVHDEQGHQYDYVAPTQ